MKILALHLSDIHFSEKNLEVSHVADKIVATTFSKLKLIDMVLVIVSGDIAYAGKKHEYQIAQEFFENIKKLIHAEHNVVVNFIFSPGNHDCDFSGSQTIRDILVSQVIKDPSKAKDVDVVTACTEIQKEFFAFRDSFDSRSNIVFDSKLITSYLFSLGDKSIVIDCINVAWMSQLHEEQGTLVYPIDVMNEVLKIKADLRFVVMHHPLNWYGQTTYRPFRRLVRKMANFLFTGHEHEQLIGENLDSESGFSVYIEGGVLQTHKFSNESSFNIVEVSLDESKYYSQIYKWNNGFFNHLDESIWQNYRTIPAKENDELFVNHDFYTRLDDAGAPFRHPAKENIYLSDIYIFPDLKVVGDMDSSLKGIISSSSFVKFDKLPANILITGMEKAGKSSLIKRLYRVYCDTGYFPILINGGEVKDNVRSLDKLVKRAFSSQYSAELFTKYDQTESTRKIIFIDDFDDNKLNNKTKSEVLVKLQAIAAKIFITVSDRFEIEELLKDGNVESLLDFKEYKILEFGYKLRFDLIRKWLTLGREDSDENVLKVNEVDQVEKALNLMVGKNLMPRVPFILLAILQNLEVQKHSEVQNSSYGDCYRALIATAFVKAGAKQNEIKEFMQICSLLSWEFCNNNIKQLDERIVIDVDRYYSDTFHRRDFTERMRILHDSKILEKNDNGGYEFCYQYIYYFFVGMYFADNLNRSDIRDKIQRYCNHLYVRDYANIILFLAHHSRDEFVCESIVSVLRGLFNTKTPISFEGETETLRHLVDSAPSLVFHDSDVIENRRNLCETKDEQEHEELGDTSVDIEEKDANTISVISRLNLLNKTTEILGLIIKNQYALISNDRKIKLFEEIFNGQLRSLKEFFDVVSENKDVLLFVIERAFLEKNHNISLEKKTKMAKMIVFFVIVAFSHNVIQKTATFVGSEYLEEVISGYTSDRGEIAFRLIDLAIKLDINKRVPIELIREINHMTQHSPFASGILRQLVLNYLYMFKTTEKDKQRICSELDIKMQSQRMIDIKTKRSKLG